MAAMRFQQVQRFILSKKKYFGVRGTLKKLTKSSFIPTEHQKTQTTQTRKAVKPSCIKILKREFHEGATTAAGKYNRHYKIELPNEWSILRAFHVGHV